MNWVLAVTLTISCTLVLTSCSDDSSDNPVALSQSRVGYSAWGTQVSYTHCEPLPKTGMPEFVRLTPCLAPCDIDIKYDEQKHYLFKYPVR